MAEFRFDDRVAIVTGAGRGRGRAYAELLASRGALVVVNDDGASVEGDSPDASVAQEVVAAIEAAGGVAVASGESVASEEGADALVQTALDAFDGRIDILVNNAGILNDKSLLNMTPDAFDKVLNVHLRGAFLVTRPVFRVMRERKYGRIVNATSIAGTYGNFGQTNYSAAKMGLVGMARTLGIEGAKYNIKANVIAPGAWTRMTENLMPASSSDSMGPDKVAPAVAWLCHEDCDLTGQVIAAAGGRFGHIFVGETVGWYSPKPTVEDFAAHLDQIMDRTDYATPADVAASSALFPKARERSN
jgi:NAD(P)-dependent dehydrogenase (short-subunit alcohol dehydrogenase family)